MAKKIKNKYMKYLHTSENFIGNQRDRFLIEKIRFRTISNKAITLLD